MTIARLTNSADAVLDEIALSRRRPVRVIVAPQPTCDRTSRALPARMS